MSKLYVWVNSKLSALQKGLQCGHIVGEIANSVAEDNFSPDADQEFREWYSRGKKIVCLEGGNQAEMMQLGDLLEQIPEGDDYPWAAFVEEDLNDATAAIGIVLDEQWDKERRALFPDPNEWETLLLSKLVQSREAA